MPNKQNNHQQPSKEELKATEEVAIKAAEELEGRQTIPLDEEEPVESEDSGNSISTDSPPSDSQLPEEAPAEPIPADVEQQEEQADPSKELYKKKFSASSRENQKINAKNRVINKALVDAEDVPEPTEEELIGEFPDWDIMSDVEKTLAKETVISRNWRKVISQAKEQATKIEKWNESVEEFTEDPKTLIDNPDLEGKTDEFKTFAQEETNNSVPFNILVSAFLHDHSTNKPNNKGRMFERGLGGSNEKPIPKSDKITLEEARQLRETNYSKYREMLIADRIESNL